jgi:hypothetical protein
VAAIRVALDVARPRLKNLPKQVAKKVVPLWLRALLLTVQRRQRKVLPLGSGMLKPESKAQENAMSTKIEKRDEVNPDESEDKYGDVEFAGPTNSKYPIDCGDHVRAAWLYVNQHDNAAKYDKDEVETIKGHIKRVAKSMSLRSMMGQSKICALQVIKQM